MIVQISKTYFILKKIAEALEDNLNYQTNQHLIDPQGITTTTIYLSKNDFLEDTEPLLQCCNSSFLSESFEEEPLIPSIAVDFAPELFTNEEQKRLTQIEELKLFASYKGEGGDMGYVIDFGNDSIGAAKIISKVLINVKNIGMSTKLFCISEPGYSNENLLNWANDLKDEQVKNHIIQRIKKTSITEAKKGNCFIATATLGGYENPIVEELQYFRDNWLANRKWGLNFIKWYYKYGPIAANFVRRSLFLKFISRYFIINLLYFVSKRILK